MVWQMLLSPRGEQKVIFWGQIQGFVEERVFGGGSFYDSLSGLRLNQVLKPAEGSPSTIPPSRKRAPA